MKPNYNQYADAAIQHKLINNNDDNFIVNGSVTVSFHYCYSRFSIAIM